MIADSTRASPPGTRIACTFPGAGTNPAAVSSAYTRISKACPNGPGI